MEVEPGTKVVSKNKPKLMSAKRAKKHHGKGEVALGSEKADKA